MEGTKMPKFPNGRKGDSNPGSLDCESGILPLSYRAPCNSFHRRPNVFGTNKK